MSDGYTPVFVLPNVPIASALGCDIAMLAPSHDPRIKALKRAHPKFGRFLKRFTDNFGERFEPATLIIRDDAPPAFRDVSALASFRDVLAIATISHARALELRHHRGHRVTFGEAFAIYPWMLDRHYEEMIGTTPAILSTHEVSLFRGQSSPAIFRTPLSEGDIDQPLLEALLARWERHHGSSTPDWADTALMRSLNMAYNASLLPAGSETTLYDVGRVVSLWVSAFEILVHPGTNGQANIGKVFDLLETTPWLLASSESPDHETGKTRRKRPLACWLYQALYDCRNNFLHGNPVDRTSLILPGPQRTIFEFAAPLYRMALTAFLPLRFDAPMPSADDPRALGAFIADRMAFNDAQKIAEEALLTAVQPAKTPMAHRRVTRPAPTR